MMKIQYNTTVAQHYLLKVDDFREKHPLTVYTFPVLALLIVTCINLVSQIFHDSLMLQYAAIIILTSWYSGLLASAVVIIASIVSANYFFSHYYDIFFALVFFPTAIIISSLVVSQRKALIAVHRLALHDTVTGLANRRLLYEKLELIMKMAIRGNSKFGIIFIDIDGFKKLNDQFGHEFGDYVLKHVASCLENNARAEDVVSRYGGDEFMIVLNRIKNADEALQAAQRISTAFSSSFHYQGITTQLTVSMGVSIYPEHGLGYNQLIRKADSALYQAKTHGRNLYILA